MGRIYPRSRPSNFANFLAAICRKDGKEPKVEKPPRRCRYGAASEPTREEEDRACALLFKRGMRAPDDDFFLSREKCMLIIEVLESYDPEAGEKETTS